MLSFFIVKIMQENNNYGGFFMLILGHYLPFLKRLFVLLTAAAVSIISFIEPAAPPDFYEPAGTADFVLFDALTRAQGITTDGEHLFFSENYGLVKTDLTGENIVKTNLIAIPPALLLKGCKHIGGITYYDGKIYCPIEDSKVFENLYIAVFDAETLKLVKYETVPLEAHEYGIPWCVADKATGLLYSARRDHITTINIYDSDTLELIDYLEIDMPIHKIQGGEVYGGVLYLSVSREGQSIFAVNLATGQVQKIFDRNLGEEVEGEGMTIIRM